MSQRSRDLYYLRMAAEARSESKDPSTKVGAVLVKDDGIVSTGWNGFPPGIADTAERLSDRPTKYMFVVHAEMNAMLRSRTDIRGATLYVLPIYPCVDCAKHIIAAGIKTVVAVHADGIQDRWHGERENSMALFAEAGIAQRSYTLKEVEGSRK